MFLKKLDIVGFKSFASRVAIDFVPGVTAVVGPNGSGKSNITDSIKWVLGEQSAKSLRGSKMEDIIFAGSDTRKPLNFAEVTLTLDNEDQHISMDYNEVSVTRRVYRSGDSEFYINKQSCRLKDIVDLFMDSGLGREAYSIIGQGKIEEILSSKAEERRTIFEEAAGVLKYKHRKRKAEQKLAETKDNLYRVDDIIHELEGQIEPLKQQADVAKEYLEKRDKLEKVEVALTAYEIDSLHKQWEEQTKLVEELKDNELEISTKMKAEEARFEGEREQLQKLDNNVDELQQKLLKVSEELEKLEGQREVLKERKKNYEQNRNSLQERIKEYKEKSHTIDQQKSNEDLLLKQFDKDVSKVKEQLRTAQQEFEYIDQNIGEQIEQLKGEYIDLLNKEASMRNEVRYLSDQLKLIEGKSLRLEQDNAKFITSRNDVNENKNDLNRKLEKATIKLKKLLSDYEETDSKRKEKQNILQSREAKLNEGYQLMQKLKSRKDVLSEMQDDYAGFFQGVKEVLKQKDQKLRGIEGAIAELIQVPKEFETAIEITLGSSMQQVVVENEQAAREAIQFLKQQRHGRATFLPMTTIRPRTVSVQDLQLVKQHPSFVGQASTLVTFDRRYESVISNLLGHVIITKDLQGANELARKINHRYRIVTLEGDVVNPGGSMTGGSTKGQKSSIFSRQRELETITENLVKMESKLTAESDIVRKQKEELEALQVELASLRQQGEESRYEEQSLQGQLRELAIEEKNVNERLSLYDNEQSRMLEEKTSAEKRINELNNYLSASKTKVKDLSDTIESLTKTKNEQQSTKDSLQTNITELKVLYAEKQQKLFNQQNTVRRLQEEYDYSIQLLKASEEEFFQLEEEMNSNSSTETSLDQSVTNKRQEKEDTITAISERRSERLKLHNLIADIERETKELKKLQRTKVNALHSEEVKLNRLDVSLDNLLTHLREEYKLSFEAARMHYPLTIPADEAKAEVKQLKREIERLGTVNLGAIEEFERVEERYSFLTNQKEDLLKAQDTLREVIGEMDTEMEKRFGATFAQIKEEFRVVFVELFGGGRADLVLTEPDNLLTTGIDIVAQPPGKKLQQLGLLSGGERALTAIALLFAILKVRPVPFVILDEVEAALDEANVVRYANYLKIYSGETQFIVITHRKGTMEKADVLYGVTMQESGVSNLVSVRLEDTKELIPQN
ncbi:chromosome segregation protein SMC [Lottiidibacillus patelloidae]|uniref:Chromosome partition protein Smc n=1 Tax=Lottiidibacillus patelloidae TaxID=2670334 RepID=A0A263BYC5_9BACI|nr:chromosome segregation protein SMC [Lottiidibacillus patelloidae]OZM58572.1 chromosome segregation protein SMC [Lottiidibacillus patelloidae]